MDDEDGEIGGGKSPEPVQSAIMWIRGLINIKWSLIWQSLFELIAGWFEDFRTVFEAILDAAYGDGKVEELFKDELRL